MTEINKFLDQILRIHGCKIRYEERNSQYPNLVTFGNLPEFEEILNDQAPWYCHSLAFRIATYSKDSEKLFRRLNYLLGLPKDVLGWAKERNQWSNQSDHWAAKWDKFYQFLWLLQCFEYFIEFDLDISFPSERPAPDLRIKTVSNTIFAECTFYSKWWCNEIFLTDLLELIDINISVRRPHNLPLDEENNPFSERNFLENLRNISRQLTPEFIEDARQKATISSPLVLFEFENPNFQIILNGSGRYTANPNNAHGRPQNSLPTFLKEIIDSKKEENNLRNSRPNILMVNALGIDFQTILFRDAIRNSFQDEEIDEVWLAACGIDERLENSGKFQKITRCGYSGSDL